VSLLFAGFLKDLTLRYGRARPGINPPILSFRVSLRDPPETKRILGDTVASPPGPSFRVLRKPQAKGKTTMKLLTTSLREKLLANGRANRDTDGIPRERGYIDHKPVVKLFTPDAGCTWLLTEIDPENPDIAFGLCDLGMGCPELGSVSLSELESVRGRLGLPIERDLHFAPTKTLTAYADEAREHGGIRA
jgi:hypothetical protein